MIEGDGPVWWAGAGYTADSDAAIRYAREHDAQKQIDAWRPIGSADHYLRPTEHIWTSAS